MKLGDFGLARLFEKVAGTGPSGPTTFQRAVRGRASRDSMHVDGNGRSSRDSMGVDIHTKGDKPAGSVSLEQTSNCGTARFMAPEVTLLTMRHTQHTLHAAH